MCGLGKLCPSVYILKHGNFPTCLEKLLKIFASCIILIFLQNLVMNRLPEAKSCFLSQSTGNAPRPKELMRLLNVVSIFCSHASPRVLPLLSRRAHLLILPAAEKFMGSWKPHDYYTTHFCPDREPFNLEKCETRRASCVRKTVYMGLASKYID